MALQFLMGGSGSGKTTYLYEWLVKQSMEHEDQKYYAIVPEQFTMQTQREIVSLHPNHGMMNVDIVSFNRLAYRVFEELGIVNPTVLDDMGKSMVLRKVAANKKKELLFFQNHLNKMGFIHQLKSMISELYQYGIGTDVLEEQVKTLGDHPLLEQKMKDLSILYHSFQNYIEDKYVTAEEILDIFCRQLTNSRLLKDSVVTLDGFTGFTPVQYRLLGLMMRHCRHVIVTVTMDADSDPYAGSGEEDLFHMSCRLVQRLVAIAGENEVEVRKEVMLKNRPYHRFYECGELDFMERHFLRYPTVSYGKKQSGIVLRQALSPSAEIEDMVKAIFCLVQNEGYRYRDIAVITGDLTSYCEKIAYQFRNHQIPYFMDEKKSIMGNPMVELIRAALEVIQKDFSYESVVRYLKTGLVTEDQEMICRLENYVLALGIRGFKRWDREWELIYGRAEDLNLLRINSFREEILAPLRVFREQMGQRTADVKSLMGAIVRLLIDLHVEEQLLSSRDGFSEKKEHSFAKEYDQVYGLVMELADRLVGLLGDEVMGKKEFTDILDAGFQEIQVGLIPATLDRIVVGDLTRTRIDHIKALFFLGVNDGIIPSTKAGGGVLTDVEREKLKERKLELAPTAREDGFMQRFYLYLMMTKPSRRLYLSYSLTSSDGKSLRPSYLVNTIKRMYPHCMIPLRNQDTVLTSEMGKQKLARDLADYERQRENTQFQELYRWFYGREEYRGYVEKLVGAACYSYDQKGIGKSVARALYGDLLSGSVTRLEQYAACAYAHFLKYGLELTDRREYQLAAMDMGNLFHSSIDSFFRTMQEQGRDWKSLTEDKRQALVKECVGSVAAEYGNTIFQSSARNAYLVKRVERITDRTVWALTHQIQKGDFVPAAFEVSFSPADNLSAMKIPLSDGEQLQLKGRIDRLDLCRDGEQIYVKIIDYKSGGTSFDLSLLYYGLQMQLAVYMDAVMEMEERKNPDKQVIPAGIFYYNINDPLVEWKEEMDQETIDRQMLRRLRMNGLVNSSLDAIRHLDNTIETESDVIPVALKAGMIQESRSSVAGGERFEALRGFVRRKIKGVGQEILNGESQIFPYKQGPRTACDYCVYHSVCGFDLKTPGFRFKRLQSLKSDEIWNEIEGGEQDGNGVDQRPAERN